MTSEEMHMGWTNVPNVQELLSQLGRLEDYVRGLERDPDRRVVQGDVARELRGMVPMLATEKDTIVLSVDYDTGAEEWVVHCRSDKCAGRKGGKKELSRFPGDKSGHASALQLLQEHVEAVHGEGIDIFLLGRQRDEARAEIARLRAGLERITTAARALWEASEYEPIADVTDAHKALGEALASQLPLERDLRHRGRGPRVDRDLLNPYV